ncbi:MAG: DUF4921 family protein [Micrococcales bacterium]|nr:DUF4921 family protein [Micrococcales bacterium]
MAYPTDQWAIVATPISRSPEYLLTLPDGTVKQINPFTGTEVWTVAGREDRPIRVPKNEPQAIDLAGQGHFCEFCEGRYLETSPEKARVVNQDGWQLQRFTPADQMNATVAQFRRVPNLYPVLSYAYWQANYDYQIPADLQARSLDYLESEAGAQHILALMTQKIKAKNLPAEKQAAELAAIDRAAQQTQCDALFASGHDLIIARRHYIDGATNTSQLAGSATLSIDEHAQFIKLTVQSINDLLDANRYIRYVVVFQNWLRDAGASFDHLHKQLVSIDERGVQHEMAYRRLLQNPNTYNDDAVNYASNRNLVVAENEHALAFAGFGHRFPTIEIYSKSGTCDPWAQSEDELRCMSDMIHAMHVATGPETPCNEEWHYRPVDFPLPMPWRVMLKWRIANVAGFEGATKIYNNAVSPERLRDTIVPRLFDLRSAGQISDLRIATECACRPNPLRYQA